MWIYSLNKCWNVESHDFHPSRTRVSLLSTFTISWPHSLSHSLTPPIFSENSTDLHCRWHTHILFKQFSRSKKSRLNTSIYIDAEETWPRRSQCATIRQKLIFLMSSNKKINVQSTCAVYMSQYSIEIDKKSLLNSSRLRDGRGGDAHSRRRIWTVLLAEGCSSTPQLSWARDAWWSGGKKARAKKKKTTNLTARACTS